MEKFIRIGVDLAKNYFQILALASEGAPAVKRKLTRSKMHQFFSQIEPSFIGMEASARRTIGRENSRRWGMACP